MNTLGWTDNSPDELFTLGWFDGASFAGVLDVLLSSFTTRMLGTSVGVEIPQEPEDVFKLARILNASGRSTTHSNPAIARIAERLKRGPGGPRFH